MQWLKILLYQAQALGPSYSSWSSKEEHLGTTASATVGYAYMGGAEHLGTTASAGIGYAYMGGAELG